jgi:streptomycin 6-kinase
MNHPIPQNFVQCIREVYGERGAAWLADLPNLLQSCEQRWSINLLPPYELSYNYVAPAVRADGSPIVLKAGVPNPELTSEMESLRWYAGKGIVRLLETDPEQGVMLLEKLEPGMPLADLDVDDDTATRIAAEVMRKLWIPAPPDPQGKLCYAAKWAGGMQRMRTAFGGGSGPIPSHLADTAERLFTELLASSGPPMLLHGDLHHWNILSAQREPFLALDPKGLVGEAEYEVGALIRNRWPEDASIGEAARFTARRLDLLSEILDLDRQRTVRWCMAQAVLSAWWEYEDHQRVGEGILYLSEVISTLLR